MNILIPAYEPDERLLALIGELQANGSDHIVIVDDGSGERYRSLFNAAQAAGCTVLAHQTNQGKGRALKTGFDYLRRQGLASCVVCADSDGQHLPRDIAKVAQAVRGHQGRIVLGSRQFAGSVPLRSRFGNSATRMAYAYTTGTPVQDTQTGLRGYSPDLLDWLCDVPGERFEYEMNMLLEAPRAGYELHEVPINTVYLDGNKSSHFRPIADSAKVISPFLKFSASSGVAAVLDFLLLLLLHWMTANLLFSVVISRLCSATFNYSMNRKFVFATRRIASIRRSMPRYFALACLIVLLNYSLLSLLHENVGIPLVAAKLLTETILYAFSYWAQRRFVYEQSYLRP